MNYFLWVVLPNLSGISLSLFCVCFAVLLVSFLIGVVWLSDQRQYTFTDMSNWFKKPVYLVIALGILAAITPSQEQLNKYVLMEAIGKVKNIQDLPDNTVELINTYLTKEIAKLKGNDKHE